MKKVLKHLKELVLKIYYTVTSYRETINYSCVFILCSLSFYIQIVDEKSYCFALC